MLKRKFYLKLLMSLLLTALTVPLAQAEMLTVADGTQTSNFVPVHGGSTTLNSYVEMIYPSTLTTTTSGTIADMTGAKITGIKFYCKSSAYSYGKKYTVSIAETSQSLFGSAITTGFTDVATNVELAASITEFNIPFTTPYKYKGGNLVVKLTLTTKGTDDKSTFYGISQTGGAYTSWQISNTNIQNFLPKTTFTYEELSGVDVEPTDGELSFGEVSTTGSKNLFVTVTNYNSAPASLSISGIEAPFSFPYTDTEIPANSTIQ